MSKKLGPWFLTESQLITPKAKSKSRTERPLNLAIHVNISATSCLYEGSTEKVRIMSGLRDKIQSPYVIHSQRKEAGRQGAYLSEQKEQTNSNGRDHGEYDKLKP